MRIKMHDLVQKMGEKCHSKALEANECRFWEQEVWHDIKIILSTKKKKIELMNFAASVKENASILAKIAQLESE